MRLRSLDRLRRRFLVEAHWLSRLLRRAHFDHPADMRHAVGEFAVVALQDSWNRFTRGVILASAAGAITSGGLRVRSATGRTSHAASLALLRATWPTRKNQPPWWEPRWFDPGDASQSASLLTITNASTVTGAIGATANPIADLRAVRNFVAHRGPTTAPRVQAVAARHGRTAWNQPVDIVTIELATVPAGRELLLEAWCRQFAAVASACVS